MNRDERSHKTKSALKQLGTLLSLYHSVIGYGSDGDRTRTWTSRVLYHNLLLNITLRRKSLLVVAFRHLNRQQ